MELSLDSDIYEPSIGDDNNYIDKIPQSSKFIHGMRCPCGTRKEQHIFENRYTFATHIKSKTHIKWLQELNLKKMNFFTENVTLNETISNQKLVIAKLQRDHIDDVTRLNETISNHKLTIAKLQKENDENIKLIAHLTKKIEMKECGHIVNDLLTFD